MNVFKNISGYFFLLLIVVVFYFVYVVLQPFIGNILVSAAIAVTFYPVYKFFLYHLGGHKIIASIVTCMLIMFLVIGPVILFLFYLSSESLIAYSNLVNNLSGVKLSELNTGFVVILDYLQLQPADVNAFALEAAKTMQTVLLDGVGAFLRGTTQLLSSIFIMMLTMFFLFKDGEKFLTRLMNLTPLYNKYDKLLFERFREVSYSSIVATIITGIAQSIVAGLAYYIVGVPVFFLSIATLFASFIPFVGVAIVWVPVFIFLIIQQLWWQAGFMLLWGLLVIATIDNVLRPLLMEGKTRIHPLILFFAIFGGILVFGFWGIIYGPLIIAVALTLLEVYEKEYNCLLYGEDCDDFVISKAKKTTRRKSTSTTTKTEKKKRGRPRKTVKKD